MNTRAHALGYADRRNVHNFWAEFEARCGSGCLFQRRKKVDAEVVAHCEQIWQAHPLEVRKSSPSSDGATRTAQLRSKTFAPRAIRSASCGSSRYCGGSWPRATCIIRSPCCWRPWVRWPMPAPKPRQPRRYPSIPSLKDWQEFLPLVRGKSPWRPPPPLPSRP